MNGVIDADQYFTRQHWFFVIWVFVLVVFFCYLLLPTSVAVLMDSFE